MVATVAEEGSGTVMRSKPSRLRIRRIIIEVYVASDDDSTREEEMRREKGRGGNLCVREFVCSASKYKEGVQTTTRKIRSDSIYCDYLL